MGRTPERMPSRLSHMIEEVTRGIESDDPNVSILYCALGVRQNITKIQNQSFRGHQTEAGKSRDYLSDSKRLTSRSRFGAS